MRGLLQLQAAVYSDAMRAATSNGHWTLNDYKDYGETEEITLLVQRQNFLLLLIISIVTLLFELDIPLRSPFTVETDYLV